jgi:carbonic anhydrase
MKSVRPTTALLPALLLALTLGAGSVHASDPPAEKKAAASVPAAAKKAEEELPSATPKEMAERVREALGAAVKPSKKLTLVINGQPVATAAGSGTPVTPQSSRAALQARAEAARKKAQDAASGDGNWNYAGENGPQSWSKLRPEFNVCALGKRQSPINIEDATTLQGPAEPVQFNYTPSNGTVVNNGRTIQVDVQGENAIMVRGQQYKLQQFHFHTPSEEQINGQRTAMVAHLEHRSDDGQLAVVAVLLDPGAANPLIDKVWTYMPLDSGDRVRMPRDLLNLNELLPADQRYYQFMGSLTTPPCSEGVLWMVLKQPVSISRAQHRLFTQLYPANARPVQALNGRPVRNAQ